MRFTTPFQRLSLKVKLIFSYLVILGVGGLATSIVGSWIVSSTIMAQARRAVEDHLGVARAVYDQQLHDLRLTAQLVASGSTVEQLLALGDTAALRAYLNRIRIDNGLDFLTLTDHRGRVILRPSQPDRLGDDVSQLSVLRVALSGVPVAATEILPPQRLENEGRGLDDRARVQLVPTRESHPLDRAIGEDGMVLMAAAPVRHANGELLGALYAGVLLNRNFAIVDRVWDRLYKGERFGGHDVGSVTIFQGDVRISTNVRTELGDRAIGTLASDDVTRAVLGNGRMWNDRSFVVSDWYISAYEPIRNYAGTAVGMLFVGQLEALYTSTRDRVILSFFGIATAGFLLIIGITYYMIRSITRPIGEMVAATQNIAAGRFDQEVHSTAQGGEIALLAHSFNTMLKGLRQMKGDLEEWARTLEEKVEERTRELVAMQNRVAQSERLASLGLLSAGVAHEINNPLGAILSLTALTLEDLPDTDPNKQNLQEVVKQSERCREIVKGLLEFSRQSEAGHEPVDINEVIENTLWLIQKQAIFFNIELIKHLAPDLSRVTADKSQLQQVFMNIVVNAVQAMGEKGTLTIATRRDAAEGFVEVRISDTGGGIVPEAVDHIFDPFFSTKEDGQGTGLGLSIAYGIITKHRGSISVDTEVGKGSTFTIRLPATPEYSGAATT